MLKTFCIYTYEHREPTLKVVKCIPLQIYKSRLIPIQPKIFGSLRVYLTLRSLSREVFSYRGLTVGPGFVTMKPKQKPKISRFANDKESCAVKKTNPASITGVLVERTPMYFFSKI